MTNKLDEIIEKYDKVNVIGFSKCGTTALTNYLFSKGLKVSQSEFLIYKKDEGIKIFNDITPDFTPVVIIRNPADKLWSEYHYRPHFKDMTFNEFLNFRDEDWRGVGLHNPIAGVNYQHYIEHWEKSTGKKLDVLNLDDIKHIIPKMNENDKKPIMADKIKKEIIKELLT